MNHTEMVNEVARRLYKLTRQEVDEIVEVMLEVWQAELEQPAGYIHLRSFGRLQVQHQQINNNGAIRQTMQRTRGAAAPTRLHRYYFRFTPSVRLRQAVAQVREGGNPHE